MRLLVLDLLALRAMLVLWALSAKMPLDGPATGAILNRRA